MSDRIYNFNPGPAALPLPALEKAQKELLNYMGTGMSMMETSHRSKEFDEVLNECKSLLTSLMKIPENYQVLFLQGGASLQFAMIPMNFLEDGKSADYINTGSWSAKAIKEAKLISKVNIAATSENDDFRLIPKQEDIQFDPAACYAHITSNNTIKGTQWPAFPDTGNVPLIVDMSSDILCREVDVKQFGLIYAGAQKNLGGSGVTLVIIRNDLLEKQARELPTMLRYTTYSEKNSLYNTPPSFAIYIVKLCMEWVRDQGGVTAIQKFNEEKGRLLYGMMEKYPEFYRGTVETGSRSLMNVTMRLPSEDLEKQFISEAKEAGFHGLKGHRSVGGIRVSMYNAISVKAIQDLCGFMETFQKKNS